VFPSSTHKQQVANKFNRTAAAETVVVKIYITMNETVFDFDFSKTIEF